MNFASGNSDDDIGKWLGKFYEENTGRKLSGPYSAIGCHYNLELKGVFIFMDYTGSNIEIHGYAPGHLSRQFIRKIANYVFNELECNVLRVKINKNNKKFRSVVMRIGFVFDCVLDDYFALNEEAIIYKYRRSWAKKWIKLVDLNGRS